MRIHLYPQAWLFWWIATEPTGCNRFWLFPVDPTDYSHHMQSSNWVATNYQQHPSSWLQSWILVGYHVSWIATEPAGCNHFWLLSIGQMLSIGQIECIDHKQSSNPVATKYQQCSLLNAENLISSSKSRLDELRQNQQVATTFVCSQ